MGAVLNYKDTLERLEKELNDFESELSTTVEENGVDMKDILENLDAYEAEYYDWLQKRIEQLKQWEATDKKFGEYRRAEFGNEACPDRKDA